ncbi:MAG: two-component regulator propeller domain-containing protein, partial [Gemmatimonadaceae bacterium]|nr:two-component regulator propeller domain-containing protein [Gemmatimonadaceae bacterium]
MERYYGVRPASPTVRRFPVLAALVVAGCLPRTLRAQAPDEGGVIAVQTFDKRGDLQASVVYGITRDRDGLLWIATDEGAAVFNGHDWRAVPMPSGTVNQARSILAQRDGTMWFGTRDKVVRVRGRDTTVFTSAPDGLAPGSVYQLLEVGIFGGRQVLVSSFSGMARFDGTRWHRLDFPADFPADGVVAAETRDARGALELWVASPNVGMRRWQADRWERIGPEQGLFLSNIEWLVVPGTPRADGTRLFAVGMEGVAALRGTRWSMVSGAPQQAFRAIDVARRDGSRELWVGTTDRGLWRQTAGGQWRPVR